MVASVRLGRAFAVPALIMLAAVALSGSNASANSKAKRIMAASTPIAEVAFPGPLVRAGWPSAQFFTINQVLAQRDGAGDLRRAVVDPSMFVVATNDAWAQHPIDPVQRVEPFGHFAFRAPEGQLWAKWRRLEQEIRDETSVLQRCRAEPMRCGSPEARVFLIMIAEAEARDGRARLQVINRHVNSAIRYESDIVRHGVPDLWSAPLATLAARRGDCENYAIAKYVALREAGMAADDLRIVLVNKLSARQHHAILAARHHGRWLVLDNRSDHLFEEGELRQFVPLFALDHQGVKLLAAPYMAERPTKRATVLSADNQSTEPGVP